jgi:SAM-dependent methyltransferase
MVLTRAESSPGAPFGANDGPDPSVTYWRGFYTDELDGGERLRMFKAALAAVPASGLWLDAGCGIGMMTREFRASGLRVCGTDISAARLAEAQRLTGLPLLVDGRVSDGEHLAEASVDRLPYGDGDFDGAYSSSVLEYVPSLERALSELHRVVRKDGHLVFNLPNAFSLFRIAYAIVRRRSEYSRLVPRWAYWRWEITAALNRAGWEIERWSYYGAERSVPGIPVVVPLTARRRLGRHALAAPFVLVVARKR